MINLSKSSSNALEFNGEQLSPFQNEALLSTTYITHDRNCITEFYSTQEAEKGIISSCSSSSCSSSSCPSESSFSWSSAATFFCIPELGTEFGDNLRFFVSTDYSCEEQAYDHQHKFLFLLVQLASKSIY